MDPQTVTKLNKFLNSIDGESLSREEFTQAFQKVVALVLTVQKQNEDFRNEVKNVLNSFIKDLNGKSEMSLKEMKGKVDGLFVSDRVKKMETEHGERIGVVDYKLSDIDKKIKLIKNGDKGERGERGPAGSPDTPLMIRNKLETLEGNERLDKSAIRGLDEMINKSISTLRAGRGYSPVNTVQYADISSQCDGSTTQFNTPKYRIPVLLVGTQAPFVYKPTTDYTLGNGKITLTGSVTPPDSGQTLIFLYIK